MFFLALRRGLAAHALRLAAPGCSHRTAPPTLGPTPLLQCSKHPQGLGSRVSIIISSSPIGLIRCLAVTGQARCTVVHFVKARMNKLGNTD